MTFLFFLRRSLGITLHIGYMVESHTVETAFKETGYKELNHLLCR